MSHSKRRKFLEKSELTYGSGYVWFLFVNDRKVPGGYKQEKLQSVNHCFVRDIYVWLGHFKLTQISCLFSGKHLLFSITRSQWDSLIYVWHLLSHRTHITYIRLLFCLFVNKFNFMTCTSLGFRRFAGIFSLTFYDLIIRNWAATNTLFRVCGVDFKWVKLWRWFTHVIYNHNHDSFNDSFCLRIFECSILHEITNLNACVFMAVLKLT